MRKPVLFFLNILLFVTHRCFAMEISTDINNSSKVPVRLEQKSDEIKNNHMQQLNAIKESIKKINQNFLQFPLNCVGATINRVEKNITYSQEEQDKTETIIRLTQTIIECFENKKI